MKRRKRGGFALIAVLIVSLIAMAVIGATLQLLVLNSGAGRVSTASIAKYNDLEDALEEGRALLKERMDNNQPIPRYYPKDGVSATTPIGSVVTLLVTSVDVPERHLNARELSRFGFSGRGGVIKVKIYDMQYDPSLVDMSMPSAEMALMPPSLNLSGGSAYSGAKALDPDTEESGIGGTASNAGAYLIRSTLEVDGKMVKTHETGLIQANKS